MSRLMVAAALMVSGGCSQPDPPPDTQTTTPVPDDDGIRRSREVLTAEYKAVVLTSTWTLSTSRTYPTSSTARLRF